MYIWLFNLLELAVLLSLTIDCLRLPCKVGTPICTLLAFLPRFMISNQLGRSNILDIIHYVLLKYRTSLEYTVDGWMKWTQKQQQNTDLFTRVSCTCMHASESINQTIFNKADGILFSAFPAVGRCHGRVGNRSDELQCRPVFHTLQLSMKEWDSWAVIHKRNPRLPIGEDIPGVVNNFARTKRFSVTASGYN